MAWKLNRKCFSVLRALGKGTGDRWGYIHVGPKGCTATDTVTLIRVSLPDHDNNTTLHATEPVSPMIYGLETAKKLKKSLKDDMMLLDMPVGEEPKTGTYIVPNYDVAIPNPPDQTESITINAQRLIDILQGAIDVSDHAYNVVRLRFFKEKDCIRIDAYRDNGGQTYMAMLSGTEYDGNCIPGDPPKMNTDGSYKAVSEKTTEAPLKLPTFEGRKFRGGDRDS